MESETNTARINRKRIDEILGFLETVNPTTEFDADTFKSVIEEVIVRDNYTLEFQFKVGVTKTIQIPRD